MRNIMIVNTMKYRFFFIVSKDFYLDNYNNVYYINISMYSITNVFN